MDGDIGGVLECVSEVDRATVALQKPRRGVCKGLKAFEAQFAPVTRQRAGGGGAKVTNTAEAERTRMRTDDLRDIRIQFRKASEMQGTAVLRQRGGTFGAERLEAVQVKIPTIGREGIQALNGHVIQFTAEDQVSLVAAQVFAGFVRQGAETPHSQLAAVM
jgi:hypothetical protein